MSDPDYVPTQDVEELYKRNDDLVSEASRGVSLGGFLLACVTACGNAPASY